MKGLGVSLQKSEPSFDILRLFKYKCKGIRSNILLSKKVFNYENYTG